MTEKCEGIGGVGHAFQVNILFIFIFQVFLINSLTLVLGLGLFHLSASVVSYHGVYTAPKNSRFLLHAPILFAQLVSSVLNK